MELRQLGTTGVKVSELCLGAMTFLRESPEQDSREMLDAYLGAGGNFIDTADVYSVGASETFLGEHLGTRRQRVVLATKVRFPMSDDPNDAGLSRRHVLASVDASLRRLRTDWIDLYQIHCWDPATPIAETMEALDACVRAGKVRYLGASNVTAWQLAKMNALAEARGWARFVSLQPQYSLVSRDVERELLPLCRHDGLAVLPWSPLGGGILSGKYVPGQQPAEGTRAGDATPSAGLMRRRMTDRNHAIAAVVRDVAAGLGRSPAQVALNWVLGRPGVTAPIIGARTIAQLTDNLGATGWTLPDEAVARLDEVSAIDLGYPHDFHAMIGAR